MRDSEHIVTSEAVEMLGASPSTVKIRLHLGRRALRMRLDQEFELAGYPGERRTTRSNA
jgi:DNA-directed RNA polymerase specialized sigma24 family protein